MMKNKLLRIVITIVISLATLTFVSSCESNDDTTKKDTNTDNTTLVQDTLGVNWNSLTPAQKQEAQEAVYAEYDKSPEGFEFGAGMLYTMMKQTPPASFNPREWSDSDWENFFELSNAMAEQVITDSTQQLLPIPDTTQQIIPIPDSTQ
jgi:hypothetical protein